MKTVRKVPNPNRDEQQSCHDASCKQDHLVERIAFTAVALDASCPLANFLDNV